MIHKKKLNNLDEEVPETVNFDLQKKEDEEVNQLLAELSGSDFNSLLNKYSVEDLADLIYEDRPNTYENIIDRFAASRQVFVGNFIMANTSRAVTAEIKDKIVKFITGLTNETNSDIQTKLQQINQNLLLPTNFQIENYKPQAKELQQADENIRKVIVEISFNEYLGDVISLVKRPIEKLNGLKIKFASFTPKIKTEYERISKGGKASDSAITEAVEIISEVGRAPVFINELKEENNFGNIVEIIINLDFTLEIALAIRAKFPNQIPDSQITAETKNYMFNDIVLY